MYISEIFLSVWFSRLIFPFSFFKLENGQLEEGDKCLEHLAHACAAFKF